MFKSCAPPRPQRDTGTWSSNQRLQYCINNVAHPPTVAAIITEPGGRRRHASATLLISRCKPPLSPSRSHRHVKRSTGPFGVRGERTEQRTDTDGDLLRNASNQVQPAAYQSPGLETYRYGNTLQYTSSPQVQNCILTVKICDFGLTVSMTAASDI